MTNDYPNNLLDTLLSEGEGSRRRAKPTAAHEICPRHDEPGPRFFAADYRTLGRSRRNPGRTSPLQPSICRLSSVGKRLSGLCQATGAKCTEAVSKP